jgi:hypothetical protein
MIQHGQTTIYQPRDLNAQARQLSHWGCQWINCGLKPKRFGWELQVGPNTTSVLAVFRCAAGHESRSAMAI